LQDHQMLFRSLPASQIRIATAFVH
jgi:hypothetical protein